MAIKTPPPAARIPHRLIVIGQEKTSEIRVARTTVAPAMYIRPRLRFRFTARLIQFPGAVSGGQRHDDACQPVTGINRDEIPNHYGYQQDGGGDNYRPGRSSLDVRRRWVAAAPGHTPGI